MAPPAACCTDRVQNLFQEPGTETTPIRMTMQRFLSLYNLQSSQLRAAALVLSALLLSACGMDGDTQPTDKDEFKAPLTDTSDALFAADRLIDVQISMIPGDYEKLRGEGRSMAAVFSSCEADFEYSVFRANATIDGTLLEDVAIRKKGFLGSLSRTRPSLKLDFDTYVDGRTYQSMERMTLNNDHQDPGQTHQCLSYALFRSAGLPAPRCNYARVTVNGKLLGVYSHVESVKKDFLRRNFPSSDGNLYEGQLADFGIYAMQNFEAKTNELSADYSELLEVQQALQLDDENFAAQIGQLIDIDQFLSFWAMEVITGHWDSATGDGNNFYIYHDPSDDLIHFIPWGTDGAMAQALSLNFLTNDPIFRGSALPNRLYSIESFRLKLHERINALLDSIWDEQQLLEQIDRAAALTGASDEALAEVRDFVHSHPDKLRAAMAKPYKSLPVLVPDLPPEVCHHYEQTSVTGTFENGVANLEITDPDGNTASLSDASFAEVGDVGFSFPLLPATRSFTIQGRDSNNKFVLLSLSIEEPELQPGYVPIHGIATIVFSISPFGTSSQGGFTFEAVGPTAADLKGSINISLSEFDPSRFLGGF